MIEQTDFMFSMSLNSQIEHAFTQLSTSELRRWFVEKLVHQPNYSQYLRNISQSTVGFLQTFYNANAWKSPEHGGIGSRILYTYNSTTLWTTFPELKNKIHWKDPVLLTHRILVEFEPWNFMRYDPDSENWYIFVKPGQWIKKGKGTPSSTFTEGLIERWLRECRPTTSNLRKWFDHLIDADEDDLITSSAQINETYDTYLTTAQAFSRIRSLLEKEPIMWTSFESFNTIKDIYPFGNGAISLVYKEMIDLDGTKHSIVPGQLMSYDREYQVINANPLAWKDHDAIIPRGILEIKDSLDFTGQRDWTTLNELVDKTLIHDCPTFWGFLTHAFPDIEEREAFLRLMAAAMYGNSLKIITALIGTPNAGKDTVIKWLEYLMPGQIASLSYTAFTSQGDDDRGFASLAHKRSAVIASEVGEGRTAKLLAEKLKSVASGGGRIRVAEKYEKPTTIFYDGMLFMQGNGVPPILGGDPALYTNRLVAVEFKHSYPNKAISFDHQYIQEAPFFALILFVYFLKYTVKGGGMTGIDPPESWRTFQKNFADQSSTYGFIETCIEKSNDVIPTTIFHAALTNIAKKFGSTVKIGAHYWPKRLRSLGFKLEGNGKIRRQATLDGKPGALVYELTINAEKSDGIFTQDDWEEAISLAKLEDLYR